MRDLREGRKSVPFLLRRGLRLMLAERSIVARQVALGAYPCGGDEALGRIAAAAVGRRPWVGAQFTPAEAGTPARTAPGGAGAVSD